jgi:hypothetical protein
MAETPEVIATNPEVQYERRDLPIAPLGWAALGFFLFVGLAPLIILAGFSSTAGDVSRQLTIHPPAPRLETDPQSDLRAYLTRERSRRDSYGWIDRAHGIAHVPVTVEMQRLARAGIAGFPRAPQRPPEGTEGGAP